MKLGLGIFTVFLAASSAFGQQVVIPRSRNAQAMIITKGGSYLGIGGLDITALELESGASETVVDFSTPNQGRMRTLAADIGAASFEARNLANANVAKVRIHGGVGGVELDFGGQWQQDMDVNVDLALGKLTLHVPRDVGVRVEVEKFLASFDEQGLVKRGDAYYSDNWDRAKYHLTLRAKTTFGGIELDRAND